MPRRECVHPERSVGSGHGTYDDIVLLNELLDYESAWDRVLQRGTERVRDDAIAGEEFKSFNTFKRFKSLPSHWLFRVNRRVKRTSKSNGLNDWN